MIYVRNAYPPTYEPETDEMRIDIVDVQQQR
jgi:hypothetical protein